MKLENAKHIQNKILKILGYGALLFGVLFLTIWSIPQPNYTDNFKSLHDLQEYANSHDEFIKMENLNILNPNYELYYQKKFKQTLQQRFHHKINDLLYYLSLKPMPSFSLTAFKNMLNDVTEDRTNRHWSGFIVQKIEVQPDSKIVVFGAIEGSFHAMVRYLKKLKELAIIDENLKLTNPRYHVVFLGNVVNRSPYMIEILTLMIRLLKNNPENVVFLHGRHDFQKYWQHHTLDRDALGREVEFAANQLRCPAKQLANDVVALFNSLPLKLYCTIPVNNEMYKYFEITPFITDENITTKLKKFRPYDWLIKSQKKLTTLNLDKEQSPAAIQPRLLAIVTDIKQRAAYTAMEGLCLLPPIDSIITWTVFSSSAERYQKSINFFYDAFVIIQPTATLKDWTITIYNRDIRSSDQKFKTKSYYFFSGNEVSKD